ncbi:hypothetical protein [Agrococcus beijingensis]|uniref:hypothetical protein n=1 Tax=Agrococcus beijingensis TaxID=3068634 RepID=UPI002741C159|nr:hypothetical protein [Agrococcus sp. REN33]
METTQQRDAARVPARVAFITAAAAALSLLIAGLSVAVDGIVELFWVMAWCAAPVAAIASIAAAVLLWRDRDRASSRRSALASLALVAAAIVMLGLMLLLQPPFGSGGGSA